MARGDVTQKDMVRAQTDQKTVGKVKEYNALQDWMCSLGEPAASLIVALTLSALVVIIAVSLKMLF